MLRILLSLCLLSLGMVQTKNQEASTSPACEVPKGQHIKIDFVRFDKKEGVIWLRLTNRTAWAIRVPVELSAPWNSKMSIGEEGALSTNHKNGAEATVEYYLEEHDPNPFGTDEHEYPPVPHISWFGITARWRIPTDESVVFKVRKEHLARNIQLSIRIRYEWENEQATIFNGPYHFAYYWGYSLPENVQSQIN